MQKNQLFNNMAKDMEDKPHLIASGVLHGDVQETFFLFWCYNFCGKRQTWTLPSSPAISSHHKARGCLSTHSPVQTLCEEQPAV